MYVYAAGWWGGEGGGVKGELEGGTSSNSSGGGMKRERDSEGRNKVKKQRQADRQTDSQR